MPKSILDNDWGEPGYVFEEEPETHPTGGVYYYFGGITLGNITTCTAQGFAVIAGQYFAMISNVSLSIYYVCSIRFQMTEQTVQKKVLPAICVVACLVFIPFGVVPLFTGMYNPTSQNPYCTLGSFPFLCNKKPWDCIRGGGMSGLTVGIVIGGLFMVMTISLVLVVISIFQTDKSVKDAAMIEDEANEHSNGNNHGHTNAEEGFETTNNNFNDHPSSEQQEHTGVTGADADYFQETKTALRFALMYIGAFFLTWIWSAIVISALIPNDGSLGRWILDYGQLFGLPSQGIFNAIIFIYNKIHVARQSKPSLTFSQALKMVVCNPSIAPEVLVASLDVIVDDVNQREEQQRINALIEADMEREEQEISAISPVSIPSNFLSLDTPSFALSNAMSSQDIDKKLEEEHKRNGDPNDTRQFYAATPEDMLYWTGDTLEAAKNLDSPPQLPLSRRHDDHSGHAKDDRCPITENAHLGSPDPTRSVLSPRPHAAGSNSNRSGPSSVFTLNSLLSGFSSVRPHSTNSHISEGEEMEDVDVDEGHGQGQAGGEETEMSST